MTSRRLAIAALAALSFACSGRDTLDRFTLCSSDAECADGQVCFPDGCGNPGEGLVVELLPSSANKSFIQDWPVDKLQSRMDIRARAPSVLQGELTQELSNSGGATAYSSDVTLTAQGESLLIPGRTRSVSFTVSPDTQGAFQVPIHSGAYQVSLTTKDPIYPPVIFSDVEITPGEAKTLDVSFRAVSSMIQVSGNLLKTISPHAPLQTAEFDIQAFDVVTKVPISQRVPVSSGTTISDGSFVLWVVPTLGMTEMTLKAFPRTPSVLAPTKSFNVPVAQNVGELELGDFGVPVNITGRVVSKTDGQALENARVHVEGTVTGGGTFVSATTQTDATGTFTLTSLPTGLEGSLDVVAEPHPTSTSGDVRTAVKIPLEGGAVPDIQAPDRIDVLGTLVRPNGDAASGVTVVAEPLAALSDDLPTPRGPTEAPTDADGKFALKLDPGEYRLDFLSTDGLPRVSRFIKVDPPAAYTGEGYAPISLPQFSLSNKRTITGTIFAIPKPLGSDTSLAPAPYASFKFFRVVTFEGKKSSLLLAEGAAEADGTYKVVLPTR